MFVIDYDEPAPDFLGGDTKNRLGTTKPKRFWHKSMLFVENINKKVKS